jgi:tetratricopeptide (TPR) repeat protein
LTPPPPSIGDPDAEEDGTLLADTLVAPPQASTFGSETLVGEPPQVDDLTRLPAPEHAATLVAPTNRRATDRGRHTGRGRPGGAGRSKSGPLEVGQDFGPRYHIIRILGVGGMGAVYQAWDAELTEAVAVKVIRPEIAADPRDAADIERRFKRELLLARQVTHKNVVRIHDLGEIDGIKYITMTYVVGADLATILKEQGKLPVPRALRIARGMVSGLVSAHQAGVVHRDLKPANIMVGADGEPTIMDFGIARSTGQDSQNSGPPVANLDAGDLKRFAGPLAGQTMAGAVIGTVEYMSPEQAKGQPADQRSDVYAFGLILYDMLVGRRRKQRAESALDELYARVEKPPPAPITVNKEIPAALDALTLRCLQPDAGKRFQTTAELQSAFDRLDENGKPLPIMRRVSRRTLLATAALVVLLLGGTFYGTRWLTAPPVVHDPVTVVIADFQNGTGDPTFDITLAQTARRALEGASFINAYDRTRISVIGVPRPEKLDEVAARELALKQGLGVVLAGSIQPRGNQYEISVKAAQTVTNDVIADVKAVASSKEQVLETATRLMAGVRSALGDDTSESNQLFAMRTLSTSSLEVIGHYAAAVEAQSTGKFEDARRSFLRAVELDPKFGLGYQGLAAMSTNVGQTEDANKYILEALRYLDGMTERERFSTRGLYSRMIGDYQQCGKDYGELIAKFPADTLGHAQRATCLAKLRDMRGALEEMQQAVKVLPNHVGYRTNLALFHDLAGDFESGEREFNAIQGEPQARTLVPLAYSQLGRGQLAEATATYERIGKMGALGASIAASGLGDIAVYQGRFQDAVRIFEAGATADVAAKNPDRAAIKHTSIAYAQLAAGRRAAAIAAAENALQASKSMAVRFLAARIFVETGAVEKARPLASALTLELPAEPHAHGLILEGLIALKTGNTRDAIKILAEANSAIDTWFGHYDLGRAYLDAKAFPQADSEFDRCIVRRGEALSLMDEGATYGFLPVVYYYQGRVREELKTASFGDSYRRYLDIRGASTDDPLVADVRRRITR